MQGETKGSTDTDPAELEGSPSEPSPGWRISLAILFLVIMLCVAITVSLRKAPALTVAAPAALVIALVIAFRTRLRRAAGAMWLVLLLFSLGLYAVSLFYQAGSPARNTIPLHQKVLAIPGDPQHRSIIVTYPDLIRVEPPDKPSAPLAAYAWPTDLLTATGGAPLSSSTTIPVLAGPFTATAVVTVTSLPTAAIPVVAGPWSATPVVTASAAPSTTVSLTTAVSSTPPITGSADISYVVAFVADDQGLAFSDDKGAPLAPEIAIGPGKSAALYLHWASKAAAPASVQVAVWIYSPLASPKRLGVIDIRIQDQYMAWWRHLLALCLGPATPLLVLAGSFIGFGWEEHKRQREEREQQKSAIEALRRLLPDDIDKAVVQYDEIAARAEGERWSEESALLLADFRSSLKACGEHRLLDGAVSQLEQKKCEAARRHARAVLRIMATEGDPTGETLPAAMERVSRLIGAYGQAQAGGVLDAWWKGPDCGDAHVSAQALRRLIAFRGRRLKHILVPALASMAGHPEGVLLVKTALKESRQGRELLCDKAFAGPLEKVKKDFPGEAAETAGELLRLRRRPVQWLSLWPPVRPPDPPPVQAWLDLEDVKLKFNPFGPEKAELDSHLPELQVGEDVESVSGRDIAVIWGAPGSGRTATALLLADKLGRTSALPAYYIPPGDKKSKDPELRQLQAMAAAVARSMISCLWFDPDRFLALARTQRLAIAQLLAISLGSVEHARQLVWQAGLGRRPGGAVWDEEAAAGLLEAFAAASPVASDAGPATRDDWLNLLAVSHLLDREVVYILADVAEPTSNNLENAIPPVQALLDLAEPLACRGVYVKAFLPIALQGCVSGVWAGSRTLSWDRTSLIQLLDTRVSQAKEEQTGFNWLFGEGTDRAANCLVEAVLCAKRGVPRTLIHVGNTLLLKHALERPQERHLTVDELDAVLRSEGLGPDAKRA